MKTSDSDMNLTIPNSRNTNLNFKTQNKQTQNTMSTVMNIINQRALVAALTEFGERLGAQLGDACPRDTFQMALEECKDLHLVHLAHLFKLIK